MRRLREESGTNIQKFEFSKRLPIISTLSPNMLSRCRPDNARRTSARAELKDVSPPACGMKSGYDPAHHGSLDLCNWLPGIVN